MTIDHFIFVLNTYPPEAIALMQLTLCLCFILGLLRYYGLVGLYAFNVIALIVGNIQVLKGGQFIFLAQPIALGTLIFGLMSLSFDIITEYYGKKPAIRGVHLGFVILAMFCILMLLTIGVKPLDPKHLQPDLIPLYRNHLHLKALFLPLPSILFASLLAYVFSQYTDVLVFAFIKELTHEKILWLRAFLATSFSALLDTTIFSLFAWKIFNPHPVSWTVLWINYILGTYPLRLLCSFTLSPFIYLAKSFLPKTND